MVCEAELILLLSSFNTHPGFATSITALQSMPLPIMETFDQLTIQLSKAKVDAFVPMLYKKIQPLLDITTQGADLQDDCLKKLVREFVPFASQSVKLCSTALANPANLTHSQTDAYIETLRMVIHGLHVSRSMLRGSAHHVEVHRYKLLRMLITCKRISDAAVEGWILLESLAHILNGRTSFNVDTSHFLDQAGTQVQASNQSRKQKVPPQLPGGGSSVVCIPQPSGSESKEVQDLVVAALVTTLSCGCDVIIESCQSGAKAAEVPRANQWTICIPSILSGLTAWLRCVPKHEESR